MKFSWKSKGSDSTEKSDSQIKNEKENTIIETSTPCTDENCNSFYCATHGEINKSKSIDIEEKDLTENKSNDLAEAQFGEVAQEVKSEPTPTLETDKKEETDFQIKMPKKIQFFKKKEKKQDDSKLEKINNSTKSPDENPKKPIKLKLPFRKKPEPVDMYDINENYLPKPINPAKFIFYSGDVAWILYRKKSLLRRKINLMRRRFFICDLGIYDKDPDFNYKYKKQSTTIYISHGKSMHPELVKKLYKLWKKKKDNEMIVELKKYEPAIAKNEYKYVEKALEDISILHQHLSIDLDTEKYLYNHRAYNPKALRMSRQFVFKGKRAVESIYPKLKVPLPWIVVMGGLIALAIVSQHLSEWIGGLTTWLGNLHFGH